MKLRTFLLLLLIILLSNISYAQDSNVDQYGSFSFQTDMITHHWESKFYNEDPRLVVLEYHRDDSKLYGIASFENSFYQSSWYVYGGKTYPIYQKHDFRLRWKFTYGIVHGYDDENGKYGGFINQLGTFPAILPTVGFNYKYLVIELIPLANEGFMITSGLRF